MFKVTRNSFTCLYLVRKNMQQYSLEILAFFTFSEIKKLSNVRPYVDGKKKIL